MITTELFKVQLSKESADRLFDIISGFYSLSDNGYKVTENKKNAALAACDILETTHKITTMDEERDTINNIYERAS